MTWTSSVPYLFTLIRDGNKNGKNIALEELYRMAEAADLYNEEINPQNLKT